MCVRSVRSSDTFSVVQEGVWGAEEGVDATANFLAGLVLKSQYGAAPRIDPLQRAMEFFTGHSAYAPSDYGNALKNAGDDLVPAGQDALMAYGALKSGTYSQAPQRQTAWGEPIDDPYKSSGDQLDLGSQARAIVNESSREGGGFDFENSSKRQIYMGATPGKYSSVGLDVLQRMAEDGQVRVNLTGLEVLNSRNQWVPVDSTDMSHIVDAGEAATWIFAAIGDVHFLSGDLNQAYTAFSQATQCPAGAGNPFIHFRLGQIQMELGNEVIAADELARAYMAGGKEIFKGENPKYFDLVRRNLKEPSSGW
jgi:hypothetical protein